MLSTECHDGFFPRLGVAESHLRATRLALAVLRVHFQNLDFKQLFYRRSHVRLGRQAIDLERVRIAACRAMHTLFRHQRLNNNLVRLEGNTCCLRYMSWHNFLL